MRKVNRSLLSLLVLLGALICREGSSQSALTKKVALIIGVKSYQHVPPLQNSINDAQDIAGSLRKKHFQVIELYDPKTKREMQEAVRKYFTFLNGQQDVAGLIFYSGHGMQVDGTNYLIPANANPQLKADLDDECLSMDYVMRAIEEAGNPLNIFILDACRNNPFRSFSRSGERGLSIVNSPKGSYLVYATKPGSVASDGTGRNGLFTSMLLKYIDAPDLNIEQVFKRVASDVAIESNDAQRPWISSDYTGDFFFTKSGDNKLQSNQGAQETNLLGYGYTRGAFKSTTGATRPMGVYTVKGTNPNGGQYIGTCEIEKREDGDFDFTWTTAGAVSKGVGRINNGIITVTYGEVYPAIYSVLDGGATLEGTWGNGTGKEALSLAEESANQSRSTNSIGGTYSVDGLNPNGTRYIGTCQITKRPDGDYDFSWKSGGSVSAGIGKLKYDIMTVAFGDASPAIYKILENGKKLDGTWASGQGKEILTRK